MMNFYMPVKVFEGENCIWNHRKEMSALGKRAFIITGKRSAKINGSYEDVKKALDAEGIEYLLFDEVEENPSVDTVMKARNIGASAGVDFVIGIGGGSPMDAAKAIALMILHKEEEEDYLYQKGADSQALPVIEIPTTCGTGSEVTPYSILTNLKTNTKSSISHRIWPQFAYIDARYLMTASKKVLCDTAMDALGHMIESYINTNANEYSRMCVNHGLIIWSSCKDALLGNRELKEEDYINLLTASTMAGMAISITGTSLPHGLSYKLTCELGMSHGKAVGYFLAGYLKESNTESKEHLLNMAGFKDIAEFESFYNTTCGIDSVSRELLKATGDDLLANQDKLKNCPYTVDRDVIQRIIGNEY